MESIAVTNLLRDTRLTDYVPIPRAVLTLSLPSTALLVYAQLLNRALLSQKNDFADSCGRVYVIFTAEQLAKSLCLKERCIRKNLGILENHGLIRRHRPVGNRANHIYVNIPSMSEQTGSTGTLQQPGLHSHTGSGGSKVPVSNRIRKQDIESNYYLYSQEDSL